MMDQMKKEKKMLQDESEDRKQHMQTMEHKRVQNEKLTDLEQVRNISLLAVFIRYYKVKRDHYFLLFNIIVHKKQFLIIVKTCYFRKQKRKVNIFFRKLTNKWKNKKMKSRN